MTCVVVNDASCLIDLRKGGLLAVLCKLPYRFAVPLPIREAEVRDFFVEDWEQLDGAGMVTYDLTPSEVAHAFALKAHYRPSPPMTAFASSPQSCIPASC